MIIDNGTIEFKQKKAGGLDPDTGHPIKCSEAGWSDPIPCQYAPLSISLLARANDERITKATYTVLIELQDLPASEQLRLKDSAGVVIGEYSLLSPPESLIAVNEIKLLI